MKIEGSKWLVTGGGSGMGRHFTLGLAKLGADVAFCDMGADSIAAVVAEGEGLPGKVRGYTCNVADSAQVDAWVNAMVAIEAAYTLIYNTPANLAALRKVS
jgi:NAD(P)-dependent dehydrogenase (short-subunit alcohol dehydrogenase family)